MKRIILLYAIPAIIILLIILGSSQAKSYSSKRITLNTAGEIPDNLKPVIKNSCMPCHADNGSNIAVIKLNFSEWNKYDSVKQVSKAEAICNVITEGIMPPKSFRKSHPNAIPSEAEKDSICNWSVQLTKK
jgi:hypothetical protein